MQKRHLVAIVHASLLSPETYISGSNRENLSTALSYFDEIVFAYLLYGFVFFFNAEISKVDTGKWKESCSKWFLSSSNSFPSPPTCQSTSCFRDYDFLEHQIPFFGKIDNEKKTKRYKVTWWVPLLPHRGHWMLIIDWKITLSNSFKSSMLWK